MNVEAPLGIAGRVAKPFLQSKLTPVIVLASILLGVVAVGLTPREEEVLLAVARGRTNAEIGDELHISLSTVKSHLASLMTKLTVRNRVEIALWAYETGRLT